MATTRNRQSSADDEGASTDTQRSAFSEEERSELDAMIAEAVGGSKPPPAAADPKAKEPRVTDSEWDNMGDRQRESWVRSLVDFRLDELSRDDEIARQRADIDRLKADKTPEAEGTPEPASPLDKVRKFLWGEQK